MADLARWSAVLAHAAVSAAPPWFGAVVQTATTTSAPIPCLSSTAHATGQFPRRSVLCSFSNAAQNTGVRKRGLLSSSLYTDKEMGNI